MSWLDNLLTRGNEAKTESAEPRIRSRRRVIDNAPRDNVPISTNEPRDIFVVTVQTAPARQGDPGAVVLGWYSVSDGVVQMREEDGKPIVGQDHRLGPGEDPRFAAWRLRRAAWIKSQDEGYFSRPIVYPDHGYI